MKKETRIVEDAPPQVPARPEVEHSREDTTLSDDQPKTFKMVSGPNGNQGGN